MKRRDFIMLGAVAATAAAKGQSVIHPPAAAGTDDLDAAVALLESTGPFDDEKRGPAFDVVQRVIDAVNRSEPYCALVKGGPDMPAADVARLYAEQPILRIYDRAFDKVLREVKETQVTDDKPAVWYLYNMGVIVKTKSCSFGIDICHRKAPLLAPYLEFALCTHNHEDHYTPAFFRAMRGKPVISSFHLCRNWYCRDFEKDFMIGDVTIRCTAADHNKFLIRAVTCFEVLCGKGNDPFTIFHSGDTHLARQLKTRTAHPDIFFGHCAIGFRFSEAAKTTMPAKLFVPVHHQELGHLGGPWRCVAFHDEPAKIVRTLRAEGFNCAMPVWGDRIV